MITPKFAAKTAGYVILKQRVVWNKETKNVRRKQSEADCRAGQQCHQGRCVQCITNDDCGPGTECSEGHWQCYSILNNCESDDDCREGLKCSLVNNECVMPECENDSDCRDWPYDSRYTCDENTFSCVLPGPVCDTEADEPNETSETPDPWPMVLTAPCLPRRH